MPYSYVNIPAAVPGNVPRHRFTHPLHAVPALHENDAFCNLRPPAPRMVPRALAALFPPLEPRHSKRKCIK